MCGILFYLSFSIVAYAQSKAQEYHGRYYNEEEIEDEGLQAAETQLPFHSYGGFGLGYGGYGGRSFAGRSFGGLGNNIGHIGTGNFPLYHRGYSGGELNNVVYGNEHKHLNDGSYDASSGQQGNEVNQGENRFSQGNVGLKSSKGDASQFTDQQGGKRVFSDGKFYKGGQYFNDQGQNADEQKKKSNHKKGHVVKGYKSSHHKDENKKTEEYYDEANDEGDSLNLQEQGKKYGENSESTLQGGHNDENFVEGKNKKQGEFNSGQFLHKDGGQEEKFGQKKYAGNEGLYGSNSGNDLESLKGHHESNKLFKHYPHYYYG